MLATCMLSVFRDIKAPYSAVEAWGYDRFVGGRAAIVLLPGLTGLLSQLQPNAAVLDVGCGGGHLLSAIAARNAGFEVTGIDLNEAQVRRAMLRLKSFGARASVRQGSALALPFSDRTFDAVISVT